MNRREFIKNMAAAAGSVSPLVKYGTGLTLGTQMAFGADPGFSDGYKALVIVNLDGGNDAMNMFIPTEATTHSAYKGHRGSIAIEKADLYDTLNSKLDSSGYFTASSASDNPYDNTVAKFIEDNESYADNGDDKDYAPDSNMAAMYRKGSYHLTDIEGDKIGLGINGVMPEFAALYKKGILSVVSNVGTLIKPTTREDKGDVNHPIPQFLYAHNIQERAVETAQADGTQTTGWAGRIADAWQGVNDPIGLNISYKGNNGMLIGALTSPVVMTTPNLESATPSSKPTSFVSPNEGGDKYEVMLNRTADLSIINKFMNYYTNTLKSAGDLSTKLGTNWGDELTFSATNSYGGQLFIPPKAEKLYEAESRKELNYSLFEQFSAATKMINLGSTTLGHSRQIIYVELGGFDGHSAATIDHNMNLRSVSLAVSDFYKALEDKGLADKVLIASVSEMGRTVVSNGDGTDHGWGGHSFILSGDENFNGGKTFGTVMTDLSIKVNDEDNATNMTPEKSANPKGKVIPTTSYEQMLAPCLKWFGVSESLMSTVLPNLANFKDDVNTGNLESMFTT